MARNNAVGRSHAVLTTYVSWAAPALLLAGALAGASMYLGASAIPPKTISLSLCVVSVFAGSLLFPLRAYASRQRMLRALAWPPLMGILTAAAMLPHEPATRGALMLGVLAIGVAILGFCLDRLTSLISVCTRDDDVSPYSALILLTLLCAAPVWLGPWVAYSSTARDYSDLVLWISPLTYLAVLVEYDYLRSQWFYLYTPFGGLRYFYPHPVLASVAYLALGGMFWLIEASLRRYFVRSRNPKTKEEEEKVS